MLGNGRHTMRNIKMGCLVTYKYYGRPPHDGNMASLVILSEKWIKGAALDKNQRAECTEYTSCICFNVQSTLVHPYRQAPTLKTSVSWFLNLDFSSLPPKYYFCTFTRKAMTLAVVVQVTVSVWLVPIVLQLLNTIDSTAVVSWACYVILLLSAVLQMVNPLNPELNPICCLLALLGANHFLHVSRIRVKSLTFRLLMSYIYGAPIPDVSRSHTMTHHSR